jgi:hypothetical protein
MPVKNSAKKSSKKSSKKPTRKKAAKKAPSRKRTKRPAAKKGPVYRPEKVLVRRLDGHWEEWASWHVGGITSTEPDTQIGWKVIADHPITAEHWSERYDRWVKLEWLGHGTPFDLY